MSIKSSEQAMYRFVFLAYVVFLSGCNGSSSPETHSNSQPSNPVAWQIRNDYIVFPDSDTDVRVQESHLHYLNGNLWGLKAPEGIPHLQKALEIYEHPGAAIELGIKYGNGYGVLQDSDEAERLFTIATRGLTPIGPVLYEHYKFTWGYDGWDDPEGLWVLTQAAKYDSISAIVKLARLYEHHHVERAGTVSDMDWKSVKLYEQGAKLGDAYCQWCVGLALKDGDVVKRDCELAIKRLTNNGLGKLENLANCSHRI